MLLFLSKYLYTGVIVPVALVLPLSIALLQYKCLSIELKWFTGSLLLGGIANVAAKLYAMEGMNNMPVSHIYTVVEFLLLSMFYRQLFKGRKLYRLIPVVVIIYTLFCIANTILWQRLTTYNSYSRSAEAILVMIYAIAYFKDMLDERLSIPYQQTVTWLNAGLLLYFSGSLFLFVCGNLIMTSLSLNTIIWNIHASLVLFMYILFAIGFYHAKRTA